LPAGRGAPLVLQAGEGGGRDEWRAGLRAGARRAGGEPGPSGCEEPGVGRPGGLDGDLAATAEALSEALRGLARRQMGSEPSPAAGTGAVNDETLSELLGYVDALVAGVGARRREDRAASRRGDRL